jgi:hypothetical protein
MTRLLKEVRCVGKGVMRPVWPVITFSVNGVRSGIAAILADAVTLAGFVLLR